MADREHANAAPNAASDLAYETARAARREVAAEREMRSALRASTGLDRAREAEHRDEAARLRDLSARARDRAMEARDRLAHQQLEALQNGAAPDTAVRALRTVMATLRAEAAADRARAAADRARAADDRARAAEDRQQARIDLQRAYLDDLTGVYTRGFGLLKMRHELERAHRSKEPLVLAFVDVDGLKQINDREGHAAGDAVLRAVGAELRAKLRSYDPIVRVGGDEFVCAMSNMTLPAAAGRLAAVADARAHDRLGSSIPSGLAQVEADEPLESLIARGDAELYRIKHAL